MRFIGVTCCVVGFFGIAPGEGRADDWCVAGYRSGATSRFGASLSLSDTWLAVGDPEYLNTGAVVLYPRNGARLGNAVIVRAPTPTPSALFGTNVVVGDQDMFTFEGGGGTGYKCRSYRYVGGQWQATGELDTEDDGGPNGSNLGASLWLNGSQLVAGSPFRGLPNRGRAGAAYVFDRTGDQWTVSARLIADDADGGDNLATSVSMFDSTVFAGAPGNDNENGQEAGAVYVFSNDGSGWAQSQKLIADGGGPADEFGYAVATNGVQLFVGARWAIVNGVSSGAVYVFERNDQSWEQTATLLPTVAIDGAQFGTSLAVSGADVLVGAPEGIYPTVPFAAGHVHVFSQTGGIWSESAVLTPQDAEDNARFGTVMAADPTLAAVNRAFDANYAPGTPLSVALYARSADHNHNGIPDVCECLGDLTGDQTIGLADLALLLTNFGRTDAAPEDGDLDGNEAVDLADLTIMLASFGTICV